MTPLELQCSRCILDAHDDPNLDLDENGICRHCRRYDVLERQQVFTGRAGEQKLAELVDRIKQAGRKKEHDCILGLSGGVDSSYLAYQAHRLGLRPLAVHMDNGWDSELAMGNIESIVTKLGLKLHTYVVDWDEFRDLQLAYLKASVVDIEAVTDHAISGTVHRLAKQFGIRYILSGGNVATEAVLPEHWIVDKNDHLNLLDIHAKFGTMKLRSYPLYDTRLKKYCQYILRTQTVAPLNYMPYNKARVREIIAKELGWRDYGAKHHESVFTRFYQGYILPRKFGIDKRKAHLSNLICSRQITREDALRQLEAPIYDSELMKVDMDFVLKKLGLSPTEFENLMNLPIRQHSEFATEASLYVRYPILRPFKFLVDRMGKTHG